VDFTNPVGIATRALLDDGHRARPCQALDVAIAVHTGRIAADRLDDLAAVLFATANGGDPVAARLVSRLAEEVATMGLVALADLDLLDPASGGGTRRRGC
jgi:N-acetylglucosamine kinase-like BadF-type ATPase